MLDLAGTLIGTIAVGDRPASVAIDTGRNEAVVTNRGSNTLSVIDLSTLTVVAEIPVGEFPRGIGIHSNTSTAVVANANGGTVSIIDLAARAVRGTVPVGAGPTGVAIHEVTRTAVVTNSGFVQGLGDLGAATTVSMVNLDRMEVIATVPVGAAAFGVAVHEAEQIAVVANFGSNDVTVVRIPNPTPQVTDFEPRTVQAGTNFTLTVRGSGFIPSSVVTLNGNPLPTTFVSSTELSAEVSANLVGEVLVVSQIALDGSSQVFEQVTLDNLIVGVSSPGPGGGMATGANSIALNNLVPFLVSISPNVIASDAGEVEFTLSGNNFDPTTQITVGNAAHSPQTVTATTLTVRVAVGTLGTGLVPVFAFNPPPGGGTSLTLSLTVTDPPPSPPVISEILPSSAPAGSPDLNVTIVGSDFVPGLTTVSIDGTDPGGTVTETAIEFTLPATMLEVPTNFAVLVNTPGGGAAGSAFEVTGVPPIVNSFNPDSAPVGNPLLTLDVFGAAFEMDARVEISGTPANTNRLSDSHLQAEMGPGFFLTSDNLEIAVVNPIGGRVVAGLFDVTLPDPPTIGDVDSGVDAGVPGSLTITGTDLANASVSIDGMAVTIDSQSDTEIVVSFPALDEGPHTVTVTGLGGTDAAGFDAVPPVVVDPPDITSILPTSVTAGALSTIDVTGTNLGDVSATVNGSPATINSQSTNSLTIQVPVLAAGTHSLTVTGPGGTDSIQFDAVPPVPQPPDIISITPTGVTAGAVHPAST